MVLHCCTVALECAGDVGDDRNGVRARATSRISDGCSWHSRENKVRGALWVLLCFESLFACGSGLRVGLLFGYLYLYVYVYLTAESCY